MTNSKALTAIRTGSGLAVGIVRFEIAANWWRFESLQIVNRSSRHLRTRRCTEEPAFRSENQVHQSKNGAWTNAIVLEVHGARKGTPIQKSSCKRYRVLHVGYAFGLVSECFLSADFICFAKFDMSYVGLRSSHNKAFD